MTPIEIIGLTFALTGAALGITGAWFTSYPHNELQKRHKGFSCWVLNSPLVITSLVGVALGVWQDLNVWCFIPMHFIYWLTAIRGWMNTKVTQKDTKSVHSCEHTCGNCEQTPPGEYVVAKMEGWRDK